MKSLLNESLVFAEWGLCKQYIHQETVHLLVRHPIYIYDKVIYFTYVVKETFLKNRQSHSKHQIMAHKINTERKKKLLIQK